MIKRKQRRRRATSEQANLQAARDLIGEIIRRAKPRKDELVYAVIGAPAQASIHNKDAILEGRARVGRLRDALLRALLASPTASTGSTTCS